MERSLLIFYKRNEKMKYRIICWNCRRKYDGSCIGWEEDVYSNKCKNYIPIKK